RLPKDLGDPLLTASVLWWNAHAVPLTERWWNGFGFFPAAGMMAFSEHHLGASLIASPLQWLGCSPITAYNLTFLASFPLCATAAHACALTLTRRHDAAIVCGLAYGFNPYRVAHIEHLELLMSFGMPAALAALHLYADTQRARWIVVFAGALVIQALFSSYYILFFTVLLGMWILWFTRAWRHALAIVAAGGISAVVISPIVLGYSRVHDSYSLARVREVATYSADLSSLVSASPLSAAWSWTAFLADGERHLFPGLTITALAVAGAILSRRRPAAARDRLATISTVLLVIAAAFAAIAIAAQVAGPWRLEWGWLRISLSGPYKPFSLSVAFAVGAIALSPMLRAAFRRRSALAFYLIAASFLFVCSLGPKPALLGEQILYEPPYAWLMRLPFFGDTVRVPARFAMLAVLALSIAGSLAFNRLTSMRRQRVALLMVAIVGIVVDGWVRGLPLPTAPSGFRIPQDNLSVAVMELPLGDLQRDTAAMYRATLHGKRTVNGYNGFDPLYYHVLRLALADRDDTVLDALAPLGPIVIATDKHADRHEPWRSFVSRHPGVTQFGEDANRTFFQLPVSGAPPDRCANTPIAVAAVFDEQGEVDAAALTDQNPATRWITSHPQQAGDALMLDLGRVERLCGLVVSMGSEAELYPRALSVATSFDKVTWKPGTIRKMGGAAFRAALENPRDARISIPLRGEAARFVRLQLEQSQILYPWAVADVVVQGEQ
ncbi:MAG: discoidin domain-containing protein, partial [Chloroflexi bacterium]|nr:discoidin domain-containing protein [Chloroflexota bacterium]